MALSMEEQRILTEIATQLSEDDPRLAQRLSSFGRLQDRDRTPRRTRRVLLAPLVVAAAGIATTLVAAAMIMVT